MSGRVIPTKRNTPYIPAVANAIVPPVWPVSRAAPLRRPGS